MAAAKKRSAFLRDLFARYSDVLLAQVMQSVACNALHPIEARYCRLLLTAIDRVGDEDLPLTQEALGAGGRSRPASTRPSSRARPGPARLCCVRMP